MGRLTRQHRTRQKTFIRHGTTSHEALRGASLGVLVFGALVLGAVPVSPYSWKHLLRANDRFAERARRNRLRRALQQLERRRFISLIPEGQQFRLKITEEGRAALRAADLRSWRLPRARRWDKKWRIVFFDVSEERKTARNSLRRLLINIGFYPLQKSVFVTPVPCHHEVAMIAEYFHLEHDILLCETTHLGKAEKRVRVYFRLRGGDG